MDTSRFDRTDGNAEHRYWNSGERQAASASRGIADFLEILKTLGNVYESVRARDSEPSAWSDEEYSYVEIPLAGLHVAEFDLSSGDGCLFLRISREHEGRPRESRAPSGVGGGSVV
ncbi:MAG: hypothetical protein U0794_11460 [Isosphaeraceae bacterium]